MKYVNKVCKILFAVLVALFMLSLFACKEEPVLGERHPDYPEIRVDMQPLIDRFPMLTNCVEAYWFADLFDSSRLAVGPTAYTIAGFVVLDDEIFQEIIETYTFSEAEYQTEDDMFPHGRPDSLTPGITGRFDFDWQFSEDFENDLCHGGPLGGFLGTVLLDTRNGIVYFALQCN